MQSKIPLSVVVITKNEQVNIDVCLGSVNDWADEVIVVDDFSTDETVKFAERYTDKIFQRRMKVEGIHRNWAYGQARNEWVLSLDADEMVTSKLRNEIEKILSTQTGHNAFSIPLKNYIGNYWVRHSGWYPARKLRLFKKDLFKYEEVGVHPRVFLTGTCGELNGDIVHKGYPDFGHFLDSLNRQTTLEAQKWIDTNRRMSFLHAFRRTVDRFFRTYLRKKAYKDGFIGFMIAVFASLYQIMSYAKYWQMRHR